MDRERGGGGRCCGAGLALAVGSADGVKGGKPGDLKGGQREQIKSGGQRLFPGMRKA